MSNWIIGHSSISCSSRFICHCNLHSKQNYCSHQVWYGQHKLWVFMCCQHLMYSALLSMSKGFDLAYLCMMTLHFGSLTHLQYRDFVEPMKGRQKVVCHFWRQVCRNFPWGSQLYLSCMLDFHIHPHKYTTMHISRAIMELLCCQSPNSKCASTLPRMPLLIELCGGLDNHH